ncbi:MAG: HEAT repeat domain-containing protein [Candidatus Hermodarchaeota archaeon]
MAKKDERTLTQALGGGEALRGLKKAMRRIFKPEEDVLEKTLSEITSIQACKDAALTGDEDVRLLAVCRLGDFGSGVRETLELSLNDGSPAVRVAAAGVIANLGNRSTIAALENHLSDNDECVREALRFSIGWLQKHGEEIPETAVGARPVVDEAEILEVEPTATRTSDDVTVASGVTISDNVLEFKVTVANDSEELATDITITVLSFPADSLRLLGEKTQTIEALKPGDRGTQTFAFEIDSEAIEGEIITSVNFFDSSFDKVTAKAGNCFVRSLYSQLRPLEMSLDEFADMRKGKAYWNREHVVEAPPRSLFKLTKDILERKNLYPLRVESEKKEDMFMGVVVGAGIGRYTSSRVIVTVTAVGHVKGDLCRLRMDVLSDSSEILQIAASELFESLQIAIDTE